MVTAEQDDTGLWYVSDGPVFVAAPSAGAALELAAIARSRIPVPLHIWFQHERSGHRVTVPTPTWQTPDQRRATFIRFLKHMADLGAIKLSDALLPARRSRPPHRSGEDQA